MGKYCLDYQVIIIIVKDLRETPYTSMRCYIFWSLVSPPCAEDIIPHYLILLSSND